MKSIILASLLFFCLSLKLTAQKNSGKDSLQKAFGVFLLPNGSLNLKEPKNGFSASSPISIQFTLKKGNYFQSIFYTFNDNSLGTAVYHKNMYIVATKRIVLPGGYAGIGITKEVANGRALMFCEFGGNWDKFTPGISIGALVPFMFKIR